MNRSVLIAITICVLLAVYMLTGLASCGRSKEAAPGAAAARERMTVQVREMEAEEIAREVSLTGRTVPSRSVELKAETGGKVVMVADLRGRQLAEGEVIAEIELNDRVERLEQAKASLVQAQLEHEAALRLEDSGLKPASQVAEALARLRGAEQALRATEIDLRNTRIVAPFDGVLQERHVEVGDFLKAGDPVARFIDLDPLVVEGEATEFQVVHLHPGETGHAHLSDGRLLDGRLRYVAGDADARARTFRVELEVPNPSLAVLAGITADLRVETERVPAYRISPGLISIADDGRFGVKIVDDAGVVQFVEADIVRAEPDALWLGGLPPRIRLITIGQGFTQPGDQVNVELESASWH